MGTVLPPPGSADVLYVVDLSSYVFRAYHAIAPLSNSKGEPTHATYGTVAMLQKLVGERKPTHLAVAMDSSKRTFRHELYPEYKATRSARPPDLGLQMERSREIVEAYRIPIFQIDGVEADDLIATVVKLGQKAGLFVVIVGADKDLMQLIGERVVMWDTMRDKTYGPPEVVEKFGVPPSRMRDLLALMGDTSDNIPGVPSVGPKTAAELLLKYETIEGIYAHVSEIQKKRLREVLFDNEERAKLSQKLVSLRDDEAIAFDLDELRYGGADFERLRGLYTELGFTRMIASIPVDVAAAPPPVRREVTYRTIDTAFALRELARAAKGSPVAVGIETTSPEPMRAALVGLSLATREGEGVYVPIAHRYLGAPKQLTLEEIQEAIGPMLADPLQPKVGHDLKYLEVALGRHGLPLVGATFDVMIASYLLDSEAPNGVASVAERELGETLTTFEAMTSKARGAKLGFDEIDVEAATKYSGAHVEAVRRLAARLGPKVAEHGLGDVMGNIELPLSSVLSEMERVGVFVDLGELDRLRRGVDSEMAELEKRAHEAAGQEFNVNSPRQLETILFDKLGLRPVRRTKTGRSTDADVLEALAEEHALPGVLLEHRKLSKLKGTYIDALPSLVNKTTGRIHTEWSQAVAATGRISSNNPNLQNIPVRTDLGRAIRRAFVAPPGMSIVSADYSQIELRVLAHLSKDPVLTDAFRTGQDVHTRTAMEVFNVDEGGVTDEMRRRSKTINFGIVYGMGEVTLAKRLDISRAEAASFIEAYFKRYERVRAFMEETLATARKGEAVRTLFGRQRLLPNIRSSNGMLRAAAERVAQNTPIQGTAADLLKLAMIRLQRPVVPGARMVLTVHDELVFEVPLGLVPEAMKRVKEAMETVHDLAVPLEVDVGSGVNWGDVGYS
ncbi:MAG TPA: DNA polymerase I [Polyangiaceae bacterium]|nr:DNA polymerase I [Polyangiaceae bacterium]